MLPPSTKWFKVPFSDKKNRETFNSEVEAAAIFALAEFGRNKAKSLFSRQTEEKLIVLSKIGYPIWLFPKNNTTYIFDGFGDSHHTISFTKLPSTNVFLEKLELNSRPLEKYKSFLSENVNYFQQPVKQKKFIFKGLIVDSDFKNEFDVYRKEGIETTAPTSTFLLSPSLKEDAISSMMTEFSEWQSFFREEFEKLSECVKIINRTTSQYVTELDYEATAIKEETDAKIKAQEELVNPQIVQLHKNYKRKIKILTDNFNKDIERMQKLNSKNLRLIEGNIEKIKSYQSEAKARALKKHTIYEKKLKKKIKQIQKEVNELRKEIKNIENNLKKLNKRKVNETSNLNLELDSEIKLIRQPILELIATRDAKMSSFKQEIDKLFEKEKPVIESLNKSLKLGKRNVANIEDLSIRGPGLKNPALFAIPFYVAIYEIGLTRRYSFIPPSSIRTVGFSAKFKGALGISKIKDLLKPRFKSIATLIETMQVLSNQNSEFESLIGNLSEKNNLLKTNSFIENIQKGLVLLYHEGWLSYKEQKLLSKRLSG